MIKKDKLIKAGGIRRWAGVEYVKKLDVGPEDRSTYRWKALCREFGHRVKVSNIAPRRLEVAGVNMPIGQYIKGEDNAPKDQTKCQINQ